MSKLFIEASRSLVQMSDRSPHIPTTLSSLQNESWLWCQPPIGQSPAFLLANHTGLHNLKSRLLQNTVLWPVVTLNSVSDVLLHLTSGNKTFSVCFNLWVASLFLPNYLCPAATWGEQKVCLNVVYVKNLLVTVLFNSKATQMCAFPILAKLYTVVKL